MLVYICYSKLYLPSQLIIPSPENPLLQTHVVLLHRAFGWHTLSQEAIK